MKASELIEKLREQIEKYGDLEIILQVEKDAWCYAEDDARLVYFEKADEYFQPNDHIVISCREK